MTTTVIIKKSFHYTLEVFGYSPYHNILHEFLHKYYYVDHIEAIERAPNLRYMFHSGCGEACVNSKLMSLVEVYKGTEKYDELFFWVSTLVCTRHVRSYETKEI